MQVSVETTSSIERRMTVGVPADQIDQKVEQRLQQTAKTIRINGFRPGKVPTKVVKKRFGQSVLQEVLGEVMRDAYIEAIGFLYGQAEYVIRISGTNEPSGSQREKINQILGLS